MIPNERRIKSLQLIFGAGGGLSAIAGFVSDFLYPIAPLGLYIAVILVLVLLLSFACYSIPPINRRISAVLGFYWYFPSALTIFLGVVVMSTAYALSKNSAASGGQGNGFVADHIPEIAQLQTTLLDIKTDIHDIRETSTRTTHATERTADAVEGAKREVSADPRKELANRGILWTHDAFESAITKGEMDNIKLFVSGGMPLIEDEERTSPLINLIKSNPPNFINVFEYLTKAYRTNTNSLHVLSYANGYFNYQPLMEEFQHAADSAPYIYRIRISLITAAILFKKKSIYDYLAKNSANPRREYSFDIDGQTYILKDDDEYRIAFEGRQRTYDPVKRTFYSSPSRAQ